MKKIVYFEDQFFIGMIVFVIMLTVACTFIAAVGMLLFSPKQFLETFLFFSHLISLFTTGK